VCLDVQTGGEHHLRFSTSRSQHEALGYRIEHAVLYQTEIDTNLFAPDAEARNSVRANWVCRECFANRRDWSLSPDEDHANFANAAEKIAAQHAEVHFLLAGRDVDSDNRTLMDLIRKLGLAGEHIY